MSHSFSPMELSPPLTFLFYWPTLRLTVLSRGIIICSPVLQPSHLLSIQPYSERQISLKHKTYLFTSLTKTFQSLPTPYKIQISQPGTQVFQTLAHHSNLKQNSSHAFVPGMLCAPCIEPVHPVQIIILALPWVCSFIILFSCPWKGACHRCGGHFGLFR